MRIQARIISRVTPVLLPVVVALSSCEGPKVDVPQTRDDKDILTGIRDNFGSHAIFPLAVIVLILLVVVGYLVWKVRVAPQAAERKRNEQTLNALFSAHEFTAAQRELALRAVEDLGLQNPLLLFVDRSLLERYCRTQAGDEARATQALLDRLFSGGAG